MKTMNKPNRSLVGTSLKVAGWYRRLGLWLAVALLLPAIFIFVMMFKPIRQAVDWLQGASERIGQVLIPDDRVLIEAETVFASNFTSDSILGEASADITAEHIRSTREGDLFGWGRSSLSVDQAVATVRWVVPWEGARLYEESGRLVVHLPSAQFDGVWVLAESLPMPNYDANWMARLGDLFNGVDGPEAFRDHLSAVLAEEAANHSRYLGTRAESAATLVIEDLLTQAGIEADVVFGD